MIRLLNGAALAAGLAAALWVAVTHAGSHPAVLPMLALIVAAFLTGVAELRRYRLETQSLLTALDAAQAQPPEAIVPWLATLPEALRGAARLRLQGDRAALPGPLMTPYLTGLLVLLGLLGTFIGMVATLGGTVSALGASADLQAVRSALASPVQGLGLAFGTSVAGVAASAALGLMSALARGERTQASRALDAALVSGLRSHTEDHRRALMLEALQASVAQAQVLPAVAQRIEAALLQVAADQRASLQALVQEQARFHERAGADAARLGVELREGLNQTSASLVEGLNSAVTRIEQGLTSTANRTEQGLQDSAARVEQALHDAAQATRNDLSETAAALKTSLVESSAVMERGLLQAAKDGAQQSLALIEPIVHTGLQQWLQQVAAHQQAMAEQAQQTQRALAGAAEQGQAAMQEAAQATQAALSAQAEATRLAFVQRTAEGFESFLARFEQHTAQWLAQAAQEQAQLHGGLTTAATEAMAALRQQTSESLARDREQLAERERLLGAVDTLMQALQHAATEQRQALDGLLATAAQKLDDSAERFDTQASQVAASLATATEQAGVSAHTLATVGEGFAQALQGFSQANQALGGQLAAVEAALGQHLARSDEQLAYYVAQAREVIELTLGAQQQLLEDLRRVSRGASAHTAPDLQPVA